MYKIINLALYLIFILTLTACSKPPTESGESIGSYEQFSSERQRRMQELERIRHEQAEKRSNVKSLEKKAKNSQHSRAKPSPRPRAKKANKPTKSKMSNNSASWQQFKTKKALADLDEEIANSLGGTSKSSIETVKRFPTIESPDEVKSGETITVLVSLTEELLTPTVKVTQGKTDSQGRLKLSLPKQTDEKDWPIDVVLSASGFTFTSPNKATLHLPKAGDSSPAMFQLTVKDSPHIASQRRLYATFWYKGQYIARVVKPIVVNQANQKISQVCAANSNLSMEAKAILNQSETANLDESRNTSDLTIYMRRDWDSCASTDYFITLSSPHAKTVHERINFSENTSKWLVPKYKAFSRSGRGLRLPNQQSSSVIAEKDQMIGFGKLLFKKFAPQSFKTMYRELKNKLGDQFKSIQIYTDDPSIPWELMVADGSDSFIGLNHAIGRWIIPKTASDFTVPSQKLTIDGIRIIAPEYKGDLTLTATTDEALFIKNLPWKTKARQVQGNYAALKNELNRSSSVIYHYAGHGYTTRENDGKISDYGLILEDSRLRSLNWRGMLGDKANPSFVFFNACEVGQAEKAAGFVDGWSTTLMDTGSSGFISGLWELGDLGAAEFSKRFYSDLRDQFKEKGKASVASAMMAARKAFLQSGNSTYLAYVYYGDPALVLANTKPADSNNSSDDIDERIKKVFERYKPALYRIYKRELRRNAQLQGKIVLRITISADGKVSRAKVESSTLNSQRLSGRIISRVKRFKFGTYQAISPVTFLYPIEFHPVL